MNSKLPVVFVKWQDPGFARTGWLGRDEFEEFVTEPIYETHTIGWLTYESDDYLVVTQNIGHSEAAQTTKILKKAIIARETVAEMEVDSEVLEWLKEISSKKETTTSD